jgi:energy-coupling factor transport system ATP-binding protein
MLEVQNVTFNYSAEGEQDVPPALRDITLTINEGETIAIIGQNGSGKSTLAKMLAAILKPNSGTVHVDGIPTTARGEDIWTIRQRVGIVFQNPDDQLVANTVIDDIAFGPENLGLPRHEIEERVQEAMALLDLEAYAPIAINELSIGQKQRVAIAGVLAMRPRYLLLDEPTTMISGQTARNLLETVFRLSRERGITVIHITHFMHEVTDFQRLIVMDAGRVIMDDTPVNIFARVSELQAVGLDVPMVTHLGQRLRARGCNSLPEVVLTAEQLKGGLAHAL